MKKTFFAAALTLTAVAATAQTTAFTEYEYVRFKGAPYVATHQALVGVKQGLGAVGAVDVAFGTAQLVTNRRNNATGFEVGYSNGLNVGPLRVDGRVAYRRGTFSDTPAQLVRAAIKNETVFYGVEAVMPLTNSLALSGGYEHANTTASYAGAEVKGTADRYAVGADLALSKNVALRAQYTYTVSDGRNANGLTTKLSYSF